MLHLSFTMYVLFIAFSLPQMYQTKSFPKSKRQDIQSIFAGITKITQVNQKLNNIDLSFNVTTPSFLLTFSQINFILMFNPSIPKYSDVIISFPKNHTISFFFDLTITSLNVKTNPNQNAQVTFKSIYGEKTFFTLEFFLNSEGTLGHFLQSYEKEFYIHLPEILNMFSKSDEITTYINNNCFSQISQEFHRKVDTYLNTLLKIYPVSDAEACFRKNFKLLILSDFFDAKIEHEGKIISKVKLQTYFCDGIQKKRFTQNGKYIYTIFNNIILNVVYIVSENDVINEENGKIIVNELKYGADMFDYTLNLEETDAPEGLPEVVMSKFGQIYEGLLISDDTQSYVEC